MSQRPRDDFWTALLGPAPEPGAALAEALRTEYPAPPLTREFRSLAARVAIGLGAGRPPESGAAAAGASTPRR